MRHAAILVAAIFSVGTAFTGPALADDPQAKQGPMPPRAAIAGQEFDTYRFGATYAASKGSTAAACQNVCYGDQMCRAWSFVMAMGEAEARCELKRGGGRAEPNLMSTSGVATPTMRKQYAAAPTVQTQPSPALYGGPVTRSPAGTIVTSSSTPMGSAPSVTYAAPPTGPIVSSQATPMGSTPNVTYSTGAPKPIAGPSAPRYPDAAVSANAPVSVTVPSQPQTFYPQTKAPNTGAATYYPDRPQVLPAPPK
jgi:PAN domain